MVREIDRIDFGIQRAVNSVLHLHFCITCLDVNVGSTRLHRIVDNRVDELDDGRHFRIRRQPIKI